jgi:transposase
MTAPVQCIARIAAFVLYLLHYQLLPEKRLAALMADLFGVNLVTATIASMSRNCASRFQEFATVVRDHVAEAPVKHLDDTGFRIGGKSPSGKFMKDYIAFVASAGLTQGV